MNTDQILLDLLDHLRKTDEQKGVQGETLSEKNIIQNDNADPNKKISSTLSSVEERRTISIAKILAKTFFEVKKKNTKDTALKTSVQRIAPSSKIEKAKNFVGEKKEQSKWWLLFGAIGSLLTGLITDGPFKGILKILSKMGFKILGNFTKIISKFFTKITNFSKIFKGSKIGKIGDFFSGIFKNFSDDFLKGLKSVALKPLSNMGKIFKGGGMLAKMGKFLKPLVPALKKAPLLGNIISIGFAISRFMQGDITGGVIDTLSALSGLLYPVAPPLAYGLGIGLDVLNAFLDVKQASPENKGKGKGQILWEMTKSLGNYIWKKSYNIPILGGVRRFMDAYDLFKSGDIVGGLKKMATGMIAFTGLAPIATGMEMLGDFLVGKTPEEKANSKIKSLWKMTKSLGNYIWKKSYNIPILGGVRRFMDAYDLFKSGDIVGGLKKMATGMIAFTGLAPIATGMEMLVGMFSNNDKKETKIKPNTSWIKNVKKFIKGKMSELPYILRKPLEWMGILDGNGAENEKNLKLLSSPKNKSGEFANGKIPVKKQDIKVTNDNPKPIANISNNIKGLEEMTDVNYGQLKVLEELRNINAQTLKVIADISRQNGKPQNVNIPNPTSSDRISKGGNPVKMKISRDDYEYSPYALV